MAGQIFYADNVVFPATQAPSADVNTLDDYQEGVWTPVISFGGANVGVTYGATTGGFYTKIGNIVTISGYLELTAKGSSNGAALIIGLPFTSASTNSTSSAASLFLYKVTFANFPQAYIGSSSTSIVLYEITEGGTATALTDADFSNDSYVILSCTYRVA
jgi:hypothetical protein